MKVKENREKGRIKIIDWQKKKMVIPQELEIQSNQHKHSKSAKKKSKSRKKKKLKQYQASAAEPQLKVATLKRS